MLKYLKSKAEIIAEVKKEKEERERKSTKKSLDNLSAQSNNTEKNNNLIIKQDSTKGSSIVDTSAEPQSNIIQDKIADKPTAPDMLVIKTNNNRNEDPQKEKTYSDNQLQELIGFLIDLYQPEGLLENKPSKSYLIKGILENRHIEIDFDNDSGICDKEEIRKILNAMSDEDYVRLAQLHQSMTQKEINLDDDFQKK